MGVSKKLGYFTCKELKEKEEWKEFVDNLWYGFKFAVVFVGSIYLAWGISVMIRFAFDNKIIW
jgi:hypothetical protein